MYAFLTTILSSVQISAANQSQEDPVLATQSIHLPAGCSWSHQVTPGLFLAARTEILWYIQYFAIGAICSPLFDLYRHFIAEKRKKKYVLKMSFHYIGFYEVLGSLIILFGYVILTFTTPKEIFSMLTDHKVDDNIDHEGEGLILKLHFVCCF